MTTDTAKLFILPAMLIGLGLRVVTRQPGQAAIIDPSALTVAWVALVRLVRRRLNSARLVLGGARLRVFRLCLGA